ncbi:DUF397 domain-containing protein [Streptomyces sp. NPDC001982]|uniref:DUF397 domain-containing protein n=1 Tax=unclassified Streptomyces TaxID=2593676 RepID=UPI003325BF76
MQTTHWQRSSYSGDSSNCVYVAATPSGTVLLRGSDEPDIILTTSSEGLRNLIRGVQDRRTDSLPH